ncbi:endonuclease/exonuclease/phosphatase family protein, partial [Oesophagostomum dentatum]
SIYFSEDVKDLTAQRICLTKADSLTEYQIPRYQCDNFVPRSIYDGFWICTYNIVSVGDDGKLNKLLGAVRGIDYDVIALQETKRNERVNIMYYDGTRVILGEKYKGVNCGGVGFLVHPSIAGLVDTYDIISPRLAVLRLRCRRLKLSVSIINCYSPTNEGTALELDRFYSELEDVIRNERSLNKVVLGDFNAIIGKGQRNDERIGEFGLGSRNENGFRLASLIHRMRLFHGNSFFRARGEVEDNRWTHMMRRKKTETENLNRKMEKKWTLREIDHILSDTKEGFLDVKVVPEVEFESDHRLLGAFIRFTKDATQDCQACDML